MSGSSRARVLCAGSIVLDTIVRRVEDFRWGTTTPVEEIVRHVGGNGANTARALALLGCEVDLAGVVGNDDAADFVLNELAKSHIGLQHVAQVDRPSAQSIVLVNSRGDRQFLHHFGASEQAFERSHELTGILAEETYRHLHLASLYVLPHLRRAGAGVLRAAKAAGLTTSLDVNWDAFGEWLTVLEPCLPHVDVLFLNEDESRMMTGLNDVGEAADFLQERGATCVAQKLGQKGCAIFPRKGSPPELCHAFDVLAVDSTGAGDCFAAGFLSAFLAGRSFQEAGEHGNAAGAMSVSRLGAVAGLESAGDFDDWMRTTLRHRSDAAQ
ncbi:MAG TPA: carbohydrate kinase family protein [Acidobacteriaceae bacterium]|jgi:sugar/nucleoside kinase (ribokinase family)